MTNSTAHVAEVLVSEELDVCYEDGECVANALVDLITDTDLHVECVAIHGPGGGWPVYRFHGTKLDLVELYRRYYNAVGVAYGGDYAEAVKRLDTAEPSLL